MTRQRTLEPGTQIARYRVVSLLGAGGMGEVYRATDSNLGREVALKVLPPSVADDADRLARFDREARTLASLNHPNIASIYGVERLGTTQTEGDGPPSGGEEARPPGLALVLEYVAGATLAERLAQGPLALDDALAIARQIVDALESAHESGIVHRDLKPANIKVRDDGTVKVLDFGLAKVVEPAAASADVANSPTATLSAMTERGVILGTAAYMAPEQARGRAVDKRADIWAFGVVLYEMVTGRRLFHGEDLTEIVASVVKDTPDLSAAPREVRRLLARCLEKDPKQRLRDIGDAWLLLDEAAPAMAEGPRPAGRQWVPWAVVTMLALTSLGLFFWPESGPAEPLAAMFDVGPAPDTTMVNPAVTTALSPDGRYVVFGAASDGTSSLWLRDLESGETRPLPGTEWTASTAAGSVQESRHPFWSPDSRSLAFQTGNTLRRLDLDGGATRTLHEFDPRDRPFGPGSWSADGVILMSRRSNLMRLPAAGGQPELVFPDSQDRAAFYSDPRFLPDGRRFLFYMTSRSDPSVRGLYAGSLDDPATQVRILETDRQARYVPLSSGTGGWLLFIQDQTLLVQPFDAERLRLEGEPSVLVEDVNVEGTLSGEAGTGGFPGFWVSPAGVLAYRTGTRAVGTRLTWFDLQGQPVGTIGEPGAYGLIALSPDGSQLAAGGSVFDVARNSRTRLSTDVEESARYPVWSPDGREILFHSGSGLFRKSVGIVGSETAILSEDQRCSVPLHWSSDGRFALFSCTGRSGSTASADITVLSMTDAAAQPVDYLATRFVEGAARFSPDGRWVTYVSDVSGTFEVYVSPFPDASTAAAVMVSTAGGQQPRWRPDGRAIWYLATDLTLMEVPITRGPDAVLRAGTPEALFPLPTRLHARPEGWDWDVTPDGQRVIATVPIREDAGPLTVVMNWEARLRRSGAGR